MLYLEILDCQWVEIKASILPHMSKLVLDKCEYLFSYGVFTHITMILRYEWEKKNDPKHTSYGIANAIHLSLNRHQIFGFNTLAYAPINEWFYKAQNVAIL